MSSGWTTVKVFISSTFKDMQAERDHLVRFVFPKLREELLKHRIHLADVDLRWGVTSDQDATGVCRQVIDECRPRFMCVLGGRYGWVPEGKDKSITADEIHYGVLDREAGKRARAFFYFRKDADTLSIPEPDAREGSYREFALKEDVEKYGTAKAEALALERTVKLGQLKQAIKDAGLPVVEYHAEWSREQKRLVNLQGFGDRVHADLLASLKDDPQLAYHFAADDSTKPDEFADEAAQMDAFIEERTERYVIGSRETVLQQMQDFATASGAPNILVLTGKSGSGKSALLAKLVRQFQGRALSPLSAASDEQRVKDNVPCLIPHFIGASTGSTDLRRTLRRLCQELAKAAANTEPLPLDIKELITHFQKLLTEAGAKKRVILVFDALNQLDETDGAHWLNWLPRELPPGVRIIASVIAPTEGEKEHQTLAILRNRKDARVEALKPLDETDTQAIIEGYLKRYSKRLSLEQIAALKEKPASNLPLYILTALEELRTLGTYEEITDRIRTLPGDARALFGWILTERLARDPGFRDREGRPCGAALVEKFAACLGVSRHGLSPAELTALLDPGDPLGNVAALLRLLRPYLMRRSELLDFYHGQFREAAVAAHLDTPEKQRAAHQSVATCLQAFADPHRDGQCRDATPHALSELPHHQTRAETWPDLIATLENIFFLEAKVTHGMAFDLVEDFTAAVDGLPLEHVERQRLRLLDEALRRDIHFIARHAQDYTEGLFQCLWNSCWWFDCDEAESRYKVPDVGRGGPPPWKFLDASHKLSGLLSRWRAERERAYPGFVWVRSLRPPAVHLGAGCVMVLRGHSSRVWSAAISPDGLRIASGSTESTVRVWDVKNGEELLAIRAHDTIVNSVDFSPDGRLIASASWFDEIARVWDAQSGAEHAVLDGHKHGVCGIRFSPDGRQLVTGGGCGDGGDGTVRIWDAQSGAELALFDKHEGFINCVTFSPTGQCIASGSCDQTVRIWDVKDAVPLFVFRGHERPVMSVAFSPDGERIASASDDHTVHVWDVRNGDILFTLRDIGGSVVNFSPNGQHLVTGLFDGTLQILNAQNGALVAILGGHEQWVTDVRFSSDGLRVVSASSDKTIRIWDADETIGLEVIEGHNSHFIHRLEVAFSPNGDRLVTGSSDNTVRLWDPMSGKELAVMAGHGDSINRVIYSPDGRCIASSSNDKTVRLWDAQSGRELAVLSGHEEQVEGLAFSPVGKHLASGSHDKTVRLWNAETGAIELTLCGHKSLVGSVRFSPDGQRIVSGTFDMRLWDARSGAVLAALSTRCDIFGDPAFSPDGSLFACGSSNHHVVVWDAELRTELMRLIGHQDGIENVAFSTDGRHLVSGSRDNTTRVWDLHSRECAIFLQGNGDVAAIAQSLPFWLLARGLEASVIHAASDREIAWAPLELDSITTHPSGVLWAAGTVSHLHLLTLEGTPSMPVTSFRPESE